MSLQQKIDRITDILCRDDGTFSCLLLTHAHEELEK